MLSAQLMRHLVPIKLFPLQFFMYIQGEVKGALKDLGYDESMVYKVREIIAWAGALTCRRCCKMLAVP